MYKTNKLERFIGHLDIVGLRRSKALPSLTDSARTFDAILDHKIKLPIIGPFKNQVEHLI